MTDNRTTELREKLTERGVEYEADDRETYAYTYWGDWAYCEPLDAKPGTLGAQCELMLIPATPEQAIAATLGNERATHGTLTAEQVREAIERHSAWVIGNNRCFHDGAYEEIADELGSGTCKRIAELEQLIRDMYHEHPIYYFEQWMEDHGIEVER